MERKIMVEVSEQELELIKKGVLEEKPKENTLGKATIHSLLYELFERTPEQDKEFTTHFNTAKDCTIFSSKAKITYWAETLEKTEEEFCVYISLSNTGRKRNKESDK